MTIGRIYKISNNFNTRSYVGQTWKPILKRFKEHIVNAGSPKLHNSIIRHGPSNFKIELLWEGECTQEELDAKEMAFIKELGTLSPNGYNLKEGGSGGKMSAETREKMSSSHIGKVLSLETKAKIALATMGNARTLGRVLSDEEKQRIGARNSGSSSHWYGKRGGEHPTARKVEQWSRNGEHLIKTYGSLTEAANELGADLSSLSACCRGKRKTCRDFTWRYSQINS
jgi:group I intron endonuclease